MAVVDINTLTTYSSASVVLAKYSFEIGDPVYIDGKITATAATVGSVVKIEAYRMGTDALVATPLSTTHPFPFNTVQSVKTDINAGTAPSIDTTGYSAGQYYLKLTLSGTGVETTYLEVGFDIIPVDSPCLVDMGVRAYLSGVETYEFQEGDTLDINGEVKLSEDSVDVIVKTYLSDGVGGWIDIDQISPLYTFTKDVSATFTNIYGSKKLPKWTVASPLATRNVKTVLSGGTPAIYAQFDFEIGIDVSVPSATTPVISDVTMSSDAITQADSTTITFKVTNMTSTDFADVEALGRGIIYRASTTDYLNYTITLHGENYPLMTDNIMRISAINDGRSAIDDTLTLTVTAVDSSPAYYKKEEIDVPDLPDLVRQLLTDPLLNHYLYRVVKNERIITNYQGTWDELPAIYIIEISDKPDMVEEAIPGGVGSTWVSTVQIHLITSDDSYCNYPPPDVGDLDDESTRFDGAEKVLGVLKQLVYRTIAENRFGYASDVLATFQWDDAKYEGSELIAGGYDGVKDNWAIIMTYSFECEVVSRDG